MGADSKIEWTRGDDGTPGATWNPTRGCSRVSSGCKNCYAERVAARFSGHGQPYAGLATRSPARWTGEVRLVPEMLGAPLRWKPRRIFVNSMSDMFHEVLSDEEIAAVFGVMAAAPQHTFQILTKRPERMRRWFESYIPLDSLPLAALHEAYRRLGRDKPFLDAHTAYPLPNVWLGCSVEDQATADARIPLLLQTPAAVRFVSYEPALAAVDFRTALFGQGDGTGIDWLIVGGESGPGARPFDLAWARSAVTQCRATGTPVFVKQLGADPRLDGAQFPAERRMGGWDRKGGDPYFWPEDLRVREFPKVSP